jgi:hypothetical protein
LENFMYHVSGFKSVVLRIPFNLLRTLETYNAKPSNQKHYVLRFTLRSAHIRIITFLYNEVLYQSFNRFLLEPPNPAKNLPLVLIFMKASIIYLV